jgi:hypothetical protein
VFHRWALQACRQIDAHWISACDDESSVKCTAQQRGPALSRTRTARSLAGSTAPLPVIPSSKVHPAGAARSCPVHTPPLRIHLRCISAHSRRRRCLTLSLISLAIPPTLRRDHCAVRPPRQLHLTADTPYLWSAVPAHQPHCSRSFRRRPANLGTCRPPCSNPSKRSVRARTLTTASAATRATSYPLPRAGRVPNTSARSATQSAARPTTIPLPRRTRTKP